MSVCRDALRFSPLLPARANHQVNINGHHSDPLFAWLKAASGNPVSVPWNFSKFLVIGGDVVKRYSHEVGDFDAILPK